MDPKIKKEMDDYRRRLEEIYCQIPVEGIYYNSRSSIDVTFQNSSGDLKSLSIDPMVSSVIITSVVPKCCVLYRGGHGGGKSTMIENVTARLYDVPREDVVEAMIRGNDDQTVQTLLSYLNLGKLMTTGEEEVKWRKFATCHVKMIDELNRFPPSAQNALFEMLNLGRIGFLDAVYQIDDFALFATENPNDVGTYPMSRPFMDRFGLCIPVPQLPSAEDLMALSTRRDDRIYKFEDSSNPLTMKESKRMSKLVSDNIKISNDALLYMIYATESLATCLRGDFGDKSHSELSLDERCKGCDHDTTESLCKMAASGVSGRAFLDLQRWTKAYSFFLNAFSNPEKPEVQMSMVESLIPYILYHRLEPNDGVFTKAPYFGMRLAYLQKFAEKARMGYTTVREPLSQMPAILKGETDVDSTKLVDAARKDLVVQEHFMPIARAAKLPAFRAVYDKIESSTELDEEDLIKLERTLTFDSDIPPRARAFLLEKAKGKVKGNVLEGVQTI